MISTDIKKIFLGSDHAAFEEKKQLISFLSLELPKGVEVFDLGTNSKDSCHYPVYAKLVCEKLKNDNGALGILLCGSGIGVSMVANRYEWIRAARCCSVEDAKMTAAHNKANILCLGSRVNTIHQMKDMIKVWLETPFEGNRHLDRIKLFSTYI